METADGRTTGDGRHMVGRSDNHCRRVAQEVLPVTVTIYANGTVEGTAGDATLIQGHLRKNPLGAAYLVMANLDGPIVAAEGIVRDDVKLPLDVEEGQFVGGFATTGTEAGAKKTTILTASNLVPACVEKE